MSVTMIEAPPAAGRLNAAATPKGVVAISTQSPRIGPLIARAIMTNRAKGVLRTTCMTLLDR